MRHSVSLDTPVGHGRSLTSSGGARPAGAAPRARGCRRVAPDNLGCYALLIWCAVAVGAAQAPGVTAQGTVLDGASGLGIPLAHIRLSRSSGGDLVAEASTDSDGRFAFTGLASGTYVVSAEKTGYVAVMRGGASPVALAQGADTAPVTLRLSRAAAIVGNVYDEPGRVVRGATVAAVGLRDVDGAARLLPVADPVETDDREATGSMGLPQAVIRSCYFPTVSRPAAARSRLSTFRERSIPPRRGPSNWLRASPGAART